MNTAAWAWPARASRQARGKATADGFIDNSFWMVPPGSASLACPCDSVAESGYQFRGRAGAEAKFFCRQPLKGRRPAPHLAHPGVPGFFASVAGSRHMRVLTSPAFPRPINHLRGSLSMSIKPLHDRVVVKPIEADEISAGGIVIPDSAKEKSTK